MHFMKKTWRLLQTPISFVVNIPYRSTILAVFIMIFYCEYLHYNLVIHQCFWPELSPDKEDFSIPTTNENRVNVMVIADLHLKCKGLYWKGIFNEFQMRRCFQTAVQYLEPDLVFVLDDVFDKEIQHCNLEEFHDTVRRFSSIFSVLNETKIYVVAGNRDVGYHYQIDEDKNNEFTKAFKSPLVQFLSFKKNNFVLINSMAVGSDGCSLCSTVEEKVSQIERNLKCAQEANRGTCDLNSTMPVYSRPVLIQHFPLFRTSDAQCNDYDSASLSQKLQILAENLDCLNKNATIKLMEKLNPRIVFSAHIHHGCTRNLPWKDGVEVTISSFNWRKKDKPAIGLAVITTTNYEIVKCPMPRYATIMVIYLFGISILLIWIIYSYNTRRVFFRK